MALAVPLSRFTSRVGGGSTFFVRPLHTFMILSEFISKSLQDIMAALDEVEKKSPGTIIRRFTATPEFVKMGVTQFQTVEFEVMVRADEKSGSEAKLNVVAAIVGGNVKGESGKAEGHSATLRFKVPISLEGVGSR